MSSPDGSGTVFEAAGAGRAASGGGSPRVPLIPFLVPGPTPTPAPAAAAPGSGGASGGEALRASQYDSGAGDEDVGPQPPAAPDALLQQDKVRVVCNNVQATYHIGNRPGGKRGKVVFDDETTPPMSITDFEKDAGCLIRKPYETIKVLVLGAAGPSLGEFLDERQRRSSGVGEAAPQPPPPAAGRDPRLRSRSGAEEPASEDEGAGIFNEDTVRIVCNGVQATYDMTGTDATGKRGMVLLDDANTTPLSPKQFEMFAGLTGKSPYRQIKVFVLGAAGPSLGKFLDERQRRRSSATRLGEAAQAQQQQPPPGPVLRLRGRSRAEEPASEEDEFELASAPEDEEEHPTSQYRGVTWSKRSGKWQVQMGATKAGKDTLWLGYFDFENEEGAARTYDRGQIAYLGRKEAVTNFPLEQYAHELDWLEGLEGGVIEFAARVKAARKQLEEDGHAAPSSPPSPQHISTYEAMAEDEEEVEIRKLASEGTPPPPVSPRRLADRRKRSRPPPRDGGVAKKQKAAPGAAMEDVQQAEAVEALRRELQEAETKIEVLVAKGGGLEKLNAHLEAQNAQQAHLVDKLLDSNARKDELILTLVSRTAAGDRI